MSFFDQMAMYPRQQQAGVNRAASKGRPSSATVPNAAIEAAKDTGEPEAPPAPVITATGGTPPPETVITAAPDDEKKDKIPGIAKFTGAPVPMTQGERSDMGIVNAVQKEMAKRDLKDQLALMVNNDQAMIDAEEILQADHDAGMELIGRAQAKFRNRTEQLDREIQEYRTQDINPNRIFGNMTGAGRFAAALNVAVGQMASTSSGGANAAMGLVESAINRDILAAQSNRQATLSAIQQGRQLRGEEWTQSQEALVEREKMRALAYAHIRQRLSRMAGQNRTAKTARQLEAFEVLVKGKEIESRVASRQAHLGLEIDAVLSSGAQAARVNAQLQQIIQGYNQAQGVDSAQDGQLSAGDIPTFDGGVQGSTQAVLPTEAPSSPVEAGAAPAATTPAPTSTSRALEERRQRKQTAKPAPSGTALPEREGTSEEPMTPEAAAEEQAQIEAEVARIREADPSPQLSPKEMVDIRADGLKLPPNDERISVAKLGRDASQLAAQKAREEWVAAHQIPDVSKEELAKWNPSEQFAYRKNKEYSDWVASYPAVQERYFDNTGTTEGDVYRNAVEIPGMMQVLDPSKRGVLYLKQNSSLRNVPKSKRLTENDPARELKKDVFDKRQAVTDATDAAALIEEIGVPGRLAGLEFRLTDDDDSGIAGVADISIKGLAEEDSAAAIAKIRQLRTKLVTMAAKFVKAFDQTSRLSDQDMRLAMETLGFSNADTFMSGMLSAFRDGDSAMIKGYSNFMRLFGENQLRDFRSKWQTEGVIFPPETESMARKELNANITEIQARK